MEKSVRKKQRINDLFAGNTQLSTMIRSISPSAWISWLREGVFTFEQLVALSLTCKDVQAAVANIMDWQDFLKHIPKLPGRLDALWIIVSQGTDRLTQFMLARELVRTARMGVCGVCFRGAAANEGRFMVPGKWLIYEGCSVRHCLKCLQARASFDHGYDDSFLVGSYYGNGCLHRLKLSSDVMNNLHLTSYQREVHEKAGTLLWPEPPDGMKVHSALIEYGKVPQVVYWKPQVDAYHRQVIVFLLRTRGKMQAEEAQWYAHNMDLPNMMMMKNSVSISILWTYLEVNGFLQFMDAHSEQE